MALADTADLTVRLNLKDQLSGGLGRAGRNLSRFEGSVKRIGRGTGQLAGGLGRLGAIAGGIAAAGIIGATKAAIDYEDAFAGVRKTVDASTEELDALSKTFRRMATEIPIAATDLARLGEAGGALGITAQDLEEFVRITALLGVTTDLTADQAAESLGVLANVLKLTSKDFDNFGSALVALGNAGASTETAIISVAQRMGAAADLIGLSTDQVLGFASAAASLDPSAIEASGTALQRFFIDTTKAVAAGGDELKIFAKLSGQTAKQFQRSFEKDAGGALQDFLAGLGKLKKAEQLAVLEALGFSDARITRVLLGLANNTKLVNEQLGISAKAYRENTALQAEAAKRFETVASRLILLKNAVIEAGISFGEGLAPAIGRTADKLAKFIREGGGGDQLRQLGKDVGAFIDSIDWQQVIDGGKQVLGIIRTVAEVIGRLPNEVKAAGIAFIGLNKLSGGLLGAGLGNIAGGLAGALTTGIARGFASAGIGKLFVQPVFVTNPGFGLGGGPGGVAGKAAGGGAGLLSKVFVVGGTAAGLAVNIAGDTPMPIRDVNAPDQARIAAGIQEIDRAIAFWGGKNDPKAQEVLASLNAQKAALQAGNIDQALAIRDGLQSIGRAISTGPARARGPGGREEGIESVKDRIDVNAIVAAAVRGVSGPAARAAGVSSARLLASLLSQTGIKDPQLPAIVEGLARRIDYGGSKNASFIASVEKQLSAIETQAIASGDTRLKAAVDAAQARIANAVNTAGNKTSQIAGAVRNMRPPIVNVTTRLSVQQQVRYEEHYTIIRRGVSGPI